MTNYVLQLAVEFMARLGKFEHPVCRQIHRLNIFVSVD